MLSGSQPINNESLAEREVSDASSNHNQKHHRHHRHHSHNLSSQHKKHSSKKHESTGDNLDGERELLQISPLKIVIRDPLKAALKSKSHSTAKETCDILNHGVNNDVSEVTKSPELGPVNAIKNNSCAEDHSLENNSSLNNVVEYQKAINTIPAAVAVPVCLDTLHNHPCPEEQCHTHVCLEETDQAITNVVVNLDEKMVYLESNVKTLDDKSLINCDHITEVKTELGDSISSSEIPKDSNLGKSSAVDADYHIDSFDACGAKSKELQDNLQPNFTAAVNCDIKNVNKVKTESGSNTVTSNSTDNKKAEIKKPVALSSPVSSISDTSTKTSREKTVPSPNKYHSSKEKPMVSSSKDHSSSTTKSHSSSSSVSKSNSHSHHSDRHKSQLSKEQPSSAKSSSQSSSKNILKDLKHSSSRSSKSRINRGVQTDHTELTSVPNKPQCQMNYMESLFRLNMNASFFQDIIKPQFRKYIHVERYTNGGAFVLHAYHDELADMDSATMEKFVDHYFDLVFGEVMEGESRFVMGIVHGAAKPMPDFLDYLVEHFPNLTVKTGNKGKSDIETTTIEKFREQVSKKKTIGFFYLL